MKKDTRLYNVMFPVFMFILFPTVLWLAVLPVNFLIDSAVLLLSMRRCGIPQGRAVWKRSIIRIWLFGFLSDLIGAVLTFGLMFALQYLLPDLRLHKFPGATLLPIPGVALAGLLIYWFNSRFSFRNTALTGEQIRRVSIALAVFTAPYTMMIPLYG